MTEEKNKDVENEMITLKCSKCGKDVEYPNPKGEWEKLLKYGIAKATCFDCSCKTTN